MSVIAYVTEEVERQGHDTSKLDGIERVGWMLNAWSVALLRSRVRARPTMDDIVFLGKLVEQVKNQGGIRDCYVLVGGHACPDPKVLTTMLTDLFDGLARAEQVDALAVYKEFELIHPFEDGNGRTGKILLNWLKGTLLAPTFPPRNLWGVEIRNP